MHSFKISPRLNSRKNYFYCNSYELVISAQFGIIKKSQQELLYHCAFYFRMEMLEWFTKIVLVFLILLSRPSPVENFKTRKMTSACSYTNRTLAGKYIALSLSLSLSPSLSLSETYTYSLSFPFPDRCRIIRHSLWLFPRVPSSFRRQLRRFNSPTGDVLEKREKALQQKCPV